MFSRVPSLSRQPSSMWILLLLLVANPASSSWVPASAQGRIAQTSFRTGIAWSTILSVGVHSRSRTRNRRRGSTAAMLSVEDVSEFMGEIVSEAASDLLADPVEEAEILSDIGHVSSDFVVFLEPETVVLRLSVVIGRLLEMTSDYLDDQRIRNDELAFDIFLLGGSLFLLWRSAAPIVRAYFYTELSDTDCDAFEQCFRPVGVTLLQFKSMKATGCFEWITCSPGTVLVEENFCENGCDDGCDWQYLYWQYEGEVIQSFRGNVFRVITRTNGKNIDDARACGLLGDTRFLYKLELDEQEGLEPRGKMPPSSAVRYPFAKTTIGSAGATLLRIDSRKLFDLMEHDAKLESSVRRLLLKSLQRKIGNLLYAQEKLFVDKQQCINGKKSDDNETAV